MAKAATTTKKPPLRDTVTTQPSKPIPPLKSAAAPAPVGMSAAAKARYNELSGKRALNTVESQEFNKLQNQTRLDQQRDSIATTGTPQYDNVRGGTSNQTGIKMADGSISNNYDPNWNKLNTGREGGAISALPGYQPSNGAQPPASNPAANPGQGNDVGSNPSEDPSKIPVGIPENSSGGTALSPGNPAGSTFTPPAQAGYQWQDTGAKGKLDDVINQATGGTINEYNNAANRLRERLDASTKGQEDSVTNKFLGRGFGNSGLNDAAQYQTAAAGQSAYGNSLADLSDKFESQRQQGLQTAAGAAASQAGLETNKNQTQQTDQSQIRDADQQNGRFGFEQGQQQSQFVAGLQQQLQLARENNASQEEIAKLQGQIQQALQSSSQQFQGAQNTANRDAAQSSQESAQNNSNYQQGVGIATATKPSIVPNLVTTIGGGAPGVNTSLGGWSTGASSGSAIPKKPSLLIGSS